MLPCGNGRVAEIMADMAIGDIVLTHIYLRENPHEEERQCSSPSLAQDLELTRVLRRNRNGRVHSA